MRRLSHPKFLKLMEHVVILEDYGKPSQKGNYITLSTKTPVSRKHLAEFEARVDSMLYSVHVPYKALRSYIRHRNNEVDRIVLCPFIPAKCPPVNSAPLYGGMWRSEWEGSE